MASPLQAAPSAAARRPLIEVDRVTKIYETRDGPVESIRPLTFDIHDGEFLAIVGPSGCGKSTLLKMAAGLLPVTSGEIRLDGRPVSGPPDNVGIVFQSAVLLAWRTVIDNVMLQIEMRRLPKATYLPKAKALLELTGLAGFANKYPWQLSGGMQQRASICRALVHDPAVLLMDEPFGALDAMTRENMNRELLNIWAAAKKTIIVVTHSISEAVFLSNRVIILTSRPGTIAEIVKVDVPYPRRLGDLAAGAFGQYTSLIRRHFESSEDA